MNDLDVMLLSLLEMIYYGNYSLISDIEECASEIEDKAFIFIKSDVIRLRNTLQKNI